MPEEKPKRKRKPKPRTGRPVGRPVGFTWRKLVLEESDYNRVSAMAGMGLTMDQIAALLDVCPETLFKMQKEDAKLKSSIEKGRANAILAVSKTAYDMAHSGKSSDMTKFYLKCRAGWKETMDLNVNGKTEVTFITKIGTDGVLRAVAEEKDPLKLEGVDE